jgi:hypothetical protein
VFEGGRESIFFGHAWSVAVNVGVVDRLAEK